MNWRTAFHLALRALWRNRLRAVLTALGVIIGVAAVITMVAIGAGAQQRVADTLQSLGTNTLVIRPGSQSRGGVRSGAGSKTSLRLEDALAIDELNEVVAVAPTVRGAGQVRYRGSNWGTVIAGVTPDYARVRDWSLHEGSFISDQHVLGAEHVCVLGRTVAKELFGLTDPMGEHLIIKGLACRIIGVLNPKGATAWGSDQDDAVFMPLTTVQRKLLGINYIHRIEVETASRAASSRVLQNVTALLRDRHKIPRKRPDDFSVHNRAELAQTSEESARVFTWLLGSIASVSLLVGGIGIMNIMLVSVTERTREIGIRLALGARQRDILWQFLLEALLLSAIGGLIGIALGIAGAYAVAELSGLPVKLSAGSVMMAFVFAALVGAFFGLHPARRAARLRPIQALRHE